MRELTLRELQLFSLEILKDVHDFCVKNNIKYSLQDGSLIGAIRHKGFIPWDDDVDIIMPRPDYDKFCRIYKSTKYKIISPELDEDCLLAFARVYDVNYTTITTPAPWCNREMGISIDIFPADGAYENRRRHNFYYSISRLLWKASCSCRYARTKGFSFKNTLINNLVWVVSLFFNARFFAKLVNKRAARIRYGSSLYWTQMTCMGDNSKEYHRIETFDSCRLVPFEDTMVMVMEGYDEVLRDKFGDYMQIPSPENRKLHSSLSKFYWKNEKNCTSND